MRNHKRLFYWIVLLAGVLAAVVPLSAQGASTCEAGFRLFEHALGETCIPDEAQRVVVLDTGELDNALALDAPIVGAPVSDALQYQAYLSDQLEGITDTGTISEPNFEVILSLSPDLIIGSKQRYEAIYEQLSQIAPTVFTESLRVPWQDNFQLHAAALGKTAEAEQLLADYEAHVSDVQAVLGDALDSTTISIVRFRPGQVRLYLKSSYIGYILQDVGLQRPPSQDEDVFSAEISLEEVQQVDADYIFVTGYDVDDSERNTFLNSPLWQTLSAVQNGRVTDVNDDTWIAGLGVQAANLVLDDLEVLLAPETAQADATCEAGFRVFEHELLWAGTPAPLCIPEAPQRIVMIWPFHVPALLRADVPLVGLSDPAYVVDEFPEWQTALADVADVGSPPNLEAVLALEPDLIISAIWFVEENYEEFSAIAPVLAFDTAGTHLWKEVAQMLFDAAGKADAYEPLIAEYEARADELSVLIGDAETTELSLVNVRANALYLYTDYSPGGMIVADIGFLRPESQLLPIPLDEFLANAEAYSEQNRWSYLFEVSMEQIQQADGDFIIVFGGFNDEETQAALDALNEHPLWQTLEAVQAGNIYVTSQNWAGGDIAGAHNILDDIAQAFGVLDQLSPNPYATQPE